MRKTTCSLLISALLIASVLSMFIGVDFNRSSDSQETALTKFQEPRVPEHDENIWAGKYFNFLGQTMQVQGNASLVVSGDLNQDNHTDIAVVSQPNGPISLFFWNSTERNFSLEPQVVLTDFHEPILLAIGDVNNDDDIDLSIAFFDEFGDLTIGFLIQMVPGIFKNHSDFRNISLSPLGYDNPIGIIIDQFDLIEGNDIAIVCEDNVGIGDIILLFYSPGTGKFGSPNFIQNIGTRLSSSISIANATSGQASEIAVGFETGDIKIFQQPLNTTAPSYVIDTPGNVTAIKSGYLNNDSISQLPDLLAITKSPNSAHLFYRNTSTDRYPVSADMNLSLNFSPLDAEVGDLNSDGFDDIAITSNSPRSNTTIYFQKETVPCWDKRYESNFTSIENPTSIAIADFDGDGVLDICESSFSNRSTSPVAVYFGFEDRNTSASDQSLYFSDSEYPVDFAAGKFTGDETQIIILDQVAGNARLYDITSSNLNHLVTFNTGPVPSGIVTGKLNNDSYDDFVIIDAMNRSVSAYLGANTIDISENPIDVYNFSSIPTAIAIFDLDNDSLDDVVIATANDSINIFINRGNDEILVDNPDKIGASSIKCLSLEIADMDSDDLPDIVVGNLTTGNPIEIFYQITSGVFPATPDSTWPTMGFCPTDIALGDLDHDDDLDIAICDEMSSGFVILNQSADDFSEIYQPDTIDAITTLIAEDCTDDGKTDLVAVMPDISLIAIYVNGESGIEIAPQEMLLLSGSSRNASVHDLDSDGKRDIWALSIDSKAVSIWTQLNYAPMVNISPEFSGLEGEEIFISIIVRDGLSDDGSHQIEWDFGDGQSNSTTGEYSISHIYKSNNRYAITVNVTDQGNLFTEVISTANISDSSPSANISVSPAEPYMGQKTIIEATDIHYHDPVDRYDWFIDNELIIGLNESSFSYRFDSGGNHTVKLILWDADGSDSTSIHNVSVHWITIDSYPPSGILEYDPVEFNVSTDSSRTIINYSWDLSFDGSFYSDDTTINPLYSLASDNIGAPGDYRFAVRIYDNTSNWGEANITIHVGDRMINDSFNEIVDWERNSTDTSEIHFNASDLLTDFPDDYTTIRWNWDDGTSTEGLLDTTHEFIDDSDYRVELFLQDDEGNPTWLNATMFMKAPNISLEDFTGTIITKSNGTLEFVIDDDRGSISSAYWSIDNGSLNSFVEDYFISLDDFEEGPFILTVSAEDSDGNIKSTDYSLVIDDTLPLIEITYDSTRSYVGNDINITVLIADSYLSSDKVYLYYSHRNHETLQIQMHPVGDGYFWAIIPGPSNEGTLEFFITAEDMAGNVATSDMASISIVSSLLSQIWPFASIGAILAAIGIVALMRLEAMTAVDETFVIYDDGRLISHQTRRLTPGMDQDILSGMFVAVQEFVKDSFKDETIFDLRKLEFGHKSILVEKGKKIYLAVVLHGRQSRNLAKRMRTATEEIERKFEEPLANWDGDIDRMRGVKEITRKLYKKKLLGAGNK